MKPMVTAVVVAHDADEYLEETLRAISAQTIRPDRIIVVNSGDEFSFDLSENVELIKVEPDTRLDASLSLATESIPNDADSWIWILHDDSAPLLDCLEQLLVAEEKTSLVGAVAPKQVRWSNPKIIQQLGLTLTPLGTPISLVSGELDQSQHDNESDVFAVGTAGLLVRSDVWKTIGGLPAVPPLAADYELCIRIRLNGLRVLVAPQAKIRHGALSMNSQRSRRWLGGSTKLAVRKAAIHLRMAYEPLWLVLPYWLLLPLFTVVNVFWRLLQKRPDRITSELAAGMWGFFTILGRLRSRQGSVREVRAIRQAFDAPWARVRSANRSKLDDEYRQELGTNFAESDQPTSKTFIQSGGAAWIALLLAFSYQFFPQAEAAVGGGSLPLGANWAAVFEQTGVSWQRLGFGFAGPSDPFNWVLLLMASFNPTSPSSAVTWFLFLAPSLAFLGAWRTLGLLTTKSWAKNLGALVFALWPAFLSARAEAQISSTVASVALPWLVFTVGRAAGLGRSGSARSMRQTWSWVGVSGLLLAIIGVSSPILAIPALIALAATAFTRIKRFVYLFWIPLPLATLMTPLAYHLIVLRGIPAALLADPGPSIGAQSAPWWLELSPTLNWFSWGAAALLLLALGALLTKRWVLAGAIWVFVIFTLVVLSVHTNSQYLNASLDGSFVAGSHSALSASLALLLCGLIAILFEHSSIWLARGVALGTALVVLIPFAVTGISIQRGYEFKDSRVVPWLLESVDAESAGSKLLKLKESDEKLFVALEPISGLRLENQSASYRFGLADLNRQDERYTQLANLAADLRSASTKNLQDRFETLRVSCIIIPLDNLQSATELSSHLDSISLLEPAGLTEFGKLWRVKNSASWPLEKSSWWSVTKGVQIAILIGFLLLAIPTTARRRQTEPSFIDDTEAES